MIILKKFLTSTTNILTGVGPGTKSGTMLIMPYTLLLVLLLALSLN